MSCTHNTKGQFSLKTTAVWLLLEVSMPKTTERDGKLGKRGSRTPLMTSSKKCLLDFRLLVFRIRKDLISFILCHRFCSMLLKQTLEININYTYKINNSACFKRSYEDNMTMCINCFALSIQNLIKLPVFISFFCVEEAWLLLQCSCAHLPSTDIYADVCNRHHCTAAQNWL